MAVAPDGLAPVQAYKGWAAIGNGGSQKMNWYFFKQGVTLPNLLPLANQTLNQLTSLTFVVSGYAAAPLVRIYTQTQSDGQDMSWYRSSVLALFPAPAVSNEFVNLNHVTFAFDTTSDAYAEAISSSLADTGKTLSKAATLAAIRSETLLSIALETKAASYVDMVVHEVRAKFSNEGRERVIRLYEDDTPFVGTDDVTQPIHLRTSTTLQVGVVQSTADVGITTVNEVLPVEETDGWMFTYDGSVPYARINWNFFEFDFANIASLSCAGHKLDDINSLTFTISGSANDLYIRIYTYKDGTTANKSWYKSSLKMKFGSGSVTGAAMQDYVFDLSGAVTTWTGYDASGLQTFAFPVENLKLESIDRVSIKTASGSPASNLIVHSVKASFEGESAPRVIALGSSI